MMSILSIKYIDVIGIVMAIKEMDRASGIEPTSEPGDSVLEMLGVGRELWTRESGDSLVERLRAEDSPPTPVAIRVNSQASDLPETIWQRIEQHQGEQFYTARRLPVTYQVEGNGIWFFRDGRRIERKAARSQVEEAISRCPLRSTTEIKDLIDFAYLYAILTDRRIRGNAW